MFHAKLALHAVNYDFKVEFAHPPNYRLERLGVCGNAESGVFFEKAVKEPRPFFPWSAFVFGSIQRR